MFAPVRRLLALLLAGLALAMAAPGVVVAQGPGDDQYTDPFGELPAEEQPSGQADPQPEEPSPPPPPTDEAGDGTSSGDATPVAPPAEAAPDPVVPSDTTASTSGRAELARTGLPADFLAVLGLGMLCSGALMRIALLSRAPATAPLPFGRSVLHQAPRLPGAGARRRA